MRRCSHRRWLCCRQWTNHQRRQKTRRCSRVVPARSGMPRRSGCGGDALRRCSIFAVTWLSNGLKGRAFGAPKRCCRQLTEIDETPAFSRDGPVPGGSLCECHQKMKKNEKKMREKMRENEEKMGCGPKKYETHKWLAGTEKNENFLHFSHTI